MSKRCEQVSSELQHQISELINRELEIPHDSLITITKIEISPDLKMAKAFISVLPENKKGSALDYLNKNIGLIRKKLKPKIRFYTLPQLSFLIDEGEIKRREVSEILKKIQEGKI